MLQSFVMSSTHLFCFRDIRAILQPQGYRLHRLQPQHAYNTRGTNTYTPLILNYSEKPFGRSLTQDFKWTRENFQTMNSKLGSCNTMCPLHTSGSLYFTLTNSHHVWNFPEYQCNSKSTNRWFKNGHTKVSHFCDVITKQENNLSSAKNVPSSVDQLPIIKEIICKRKRKPQSHEHNAGAFT